MLPSKENDLAPYEAPFEALDPVREAPVTRAEGPHIECHLTFGSKTGGALDDAATALAARIHELVSDDEALSYGDVAILCLRTAAFQPYEDALERAGIPYVTVAGRGFYERPEIRDLLNLLRALDDPDDDLVLTGALRSPALGLSDVGLYQLNTLQRKRREADHPTLWQVVQEGGGERLSERDAERLAEAVALIQRLREGVGRVPVAGVIKRLLEETHYLAIVRQAGQRRAGRNIEKLLSDAYASGMIRLSQFDAYVRSLRDVGAREGEARALSEGAVQIMTVHASKGLEFPLVVIGDAGARGMSRDPNLLIDPEWGVLLRVAAGKQRALTYVLARLTLADREEAESLREFYVAVTRAQERLLISGTMTLKSDGTFGKADGWLGLIAGFDVLGLLEEEAPQLEEGDAAVRWIRSLGASEVACTFYPPNPQGIEGNISPEREEAPVVWPPPLLAAVAPPPEAATETIDEPASRRPIEWVVRRNSRPPPIIVGDIVHEALANWRFPDAEEFDAWALTVAESQGLVERASTRKAVKRAGKLLQRFRQHPLYAEMDAAHPALARGALCDGLGRQRPPWAHRRPLSRCAGPMADRRVQERLSRGS